MSYAVRNDGAAWRAVNGPGDCGPDERWQAERPTLSPPAPAVPRSLTPRQIRLALSQMGYREQVEAAVAAGPLALQDAWQYALEFLRDDPMVADMLTAIGATPEQRDQLWTLGATL